MRLTIAVGFLNEEEYLPVFLESMAAQSRPPDRLLLVDDGSTDRSAELADAFAAEHPYARVIRRPARPPEPDRLVTAKEFQAFLETVEGYDEDYDVIAKMDADLELRPNHVEFVMDRFEADPELGIAGAFLSAPAPGGVIRERCPPGHVRGPNRFYRRDCLEEVLPVPTIAGWEAIDIAKAHARGWKTESFALPGGDSMHLRRTGSVGGHFRGVQRMGGNAWRYGAHPLVVVAGSMSRLRDRPRVLAGIAYFTGWVSAALRRGPRADADVRAVIRREGLDRIKQRAGSGLRRRA